MILIGWGETKLNKRNYGIDLLRIVAMFMIVILHFLGYKNSLLSFPVLSVEYNVLWALEILCYCAVNCYGMISGYVLIDSSFNYKKIVRLWMSVVFWTLLITIITKVTNVADVYKLDFISAIFPVTFKQYWYFSCYFALFLFAPFINKFINSLDKRTFKKIIITIFILFSVIELYRGAFSIGNGYSFVWLVCLYFYGAYIKKYVDISKIKTIRLIKVLIACYIITFLSKYLILRLNISDRIVSDSILVNYTSFTMVIISIIFLILFSNLKINNKYIIRLIKRLSPATFGVYLIHVQKYSYNYIFGKCLLLVNGSIFYMLIYILGLSFLIYMICSYMELLRIYLFNKLKVNKVIVVIYKKIVDSLQNVSTLKINER